MPNDSKMASCCFFMPPIEKQRLFGRSNLLTNRLIVEFEQVRKYNPSLFHHQFVQFQSSNLQISSCRRKVGQYLTTIIISAFAVVLSGFSGFISFYFLGGQGLLFAPKFSSQLSQNFCLVSQL